MACYQLTEGIKGIGNHIIYPACHECFITDVGTAACRRIIDNGVNN